MSKEQDSSQLIQLRVTYKSFPQILGNVLAVCFGGLYFGYVLAYLSAIPIQQIRTVFKSDFDEHTAQGLFSGLIPVGAGFGALLSSIITARFSRRNSLLFVDAISLVGATLILIPSFYSLIVGRLIQGLCVGLFSAICPLYIKEISPIELAGRLGAMNQLSIVAGIVITNILALFVKKQPNQLDFVDPIWKFIFAVPIILAVIQAALLVFVYPNETPKYLLLNDREEEAKLLIDKYYKVEFAEQILREKKYDLKPKQSVLSATSEQEQEGKQNQKSNKLCIVIAIHLALLQQMCGVNVVVLYGGQILSDAVPNYGTLMQIFLIFTQFVACLCTAYVLKRIGRKPLLQLGTLISIIVLVVLGIAYLSAFQNKDSPEHYPIHSMQILIVVSLYIFMTSFGFTLGPVVWLYIPEIVQPNIVPFSTLANWAGASLTIILFPIIGSAIGNSSLFFFLAGWCVLSLIFNQRYIVETKDRTEKEIAREFQRLSE